MRVPTTYGFCEREIRKHFEKRLTEPQAICTSHLHGCGGDGGDAQHYLLEIDGLKLWFSNHGYIRSVEDINLHHGYGRKTDTLYQPEIEIDQ